MRMLQTRIYVLLIAIIGNILGFSAQAQNPFSTSAIKTTKVDEGLYTFSTSGARTIAIITEEGVIIGDPISPSAATMIQTEIAKLTDRPIKYVIYSHQHWDHVRGAQIFKDAGATIVSHENCLAHFYNDPHPDVILPDVTYHVRHVIKLGGRRIELWWFGPNHSDCSTFTYIPDAKIVHIVDTVTPGAVAGGGGRMADLHPNGFITSLQILEETLDYDRMIPGHGPPTAPAEAVTIRRQYQEALMTAVKTEIDAGTPLNEVATRIDLPEFSHLSGYNQYLARNAQRILVYYTIGW